MKSSVGFNLNSQKKYIKKIVLAASVIIMTAAVNCFPYLKGIRKNVLVRIAVVCRADSVRISGFKGKRFCKNYTVFPNSKLPLYFSAGDDAVVVNGKKYRGAVEVKETGGKLWVINIVNIEDYLKGVVPCEIGKIFSNTIEAAKAQAVAARTYAYAHLGQHEELGFDLYATVQDQVYNGISCESDFTTLAVEQTKGQILVYHNSPIEAKYHSTCGGRTADFNDAWPGTPPPYLQSVECPYCKKSPHYAWQKVFTRKDFFVHLRNGLKKISREIPDNELIKKLLFVKNKRSKRVKRMIILTEKNKYAIAGYEIRRVFGDDYDPGGLLKSNFIELKSRGDSIIIEGKGFGHGVGMCQFGALGMAEQGKTYREILYHYFPGTKIIKVR